MEYKRQFSIIKQIVNDVDPIGLISGGAPEDEYESEIVSVISLINDKRDTNKVDQIISIFNESFGQEVGDSKQYELMANKILQALSERD